MKEETLKKLVDYIVDDVIVDNREDLRKKITKVIKEAQEEEDLTRQLLALTEWRDWSLAILVSSEKYPEGRFSVNGKSYRTLSDVVKGVTAETVENLMMTNRTHLLTEKPIPRILQ